MIPKNFSIRLSRGLTRVIRIIAMSSLAEEVSFWMTCLKDFWNWNRILSLDAVALMWYCFMEWYNPRTSCLRVIPCLPPSPLSLTRKIVT
jgi:hypothetical protein